MKRSITRLFTVILIAVSISSACAWSGPGHIIVAAIAYRDLSPAERQKLDLILKSHPRFQSWRSGFPASVPNLDLGLYVTMAASLWPDQIRNKADPSTFPNWHFVDYPLIAPSFPDRGSPSPKDDILFGIGKSEAILRNRSASAQDKAEKMSTAANARVTRAALPDLRSHHSVKSWSKESRKSAIHDAYLDGTLPPGENATHATILPAGYTRHAKEIAEQRIALAGYRLADEIRRAIR